MRRRSPGEPKPTEYDAVPEDGLLLELIVATGWQMSVVVNGRFFVKEDTLDLVFCEANRRCRRNYEEE